MYPTSIDNFAIAIGELSLTMPDAKITAIRPAYNGNIIFETGTDIDYIWDYPSGCISQYIKGSWRK